MIMVNDCAHSPIHEPIIHIHPFGLLIENDTSKVRFFCGGVCSFSIIRWYIFIFSSFFFLSYYSIVSVGGFWIFLPFSICIEFGGFVCVNKMDNYCFLVAHYIKKLGCVIGNYKLAILELGMLTKSLLGILLINYHPIKFSNKSLSKS